MKTAKQNEQIVAGLNKEDFIDIYKETARIYRYKPEQARKELPRLLPAIRRELNQKRPRKGTSNVGLTYFFCSLFAQFGKDGEAAWTEATRLSRPDGTINLEIDSDTHCTLTPDEQELKQCPGPDCTNLIRADIDFCLACRHKYRTH